MKPVNIVETIETNELIQKLADNGFEELVEAFLMNESRIYTRSGRMNKSGACRVLNWKPKQLEDALEECRDILFNDIKGS